MRLRPLERRLVFPALLLASVIAPSQAAAQSSTRADDPTNRSAALAARFGAAHARAIERSARDVTRPTTTDSLATPYRSTPAENLSPDGFAMRLPGTGLDVTNGSLAIHHTNDGRYSKGIHVSVQLTY